MKLFALVLVAAFIARVEPHGALKDPPARNYLYFTGLYPDQPPSWNYYGIECGGNNPQDEAVSNCGMVSIAKYIFVQTFYYNYIFY
jgi:hypothetical protein